MRSEVLRDAIGYWEPRRLWYNAALTALVGTWVVWTWPHFRPAFTLAALSQLMVLAALANVVYSAAYLADLPLQRSSFRGAWQQWRWVLWLFGTLLALVFTHYWIGDEIYPFVGAV